MWQVPAAVVAVTQVAADQVVAAVAAVPPAVAAIIVGVRKTLADMAVTPIAVVPSASRIVSLCLAA